MSQSDQHVTANQDTVNVITCLGDLWQVAKLEALSSEDTTTTSTRSAAAWRAAACGSSVGRVLQNVEDRPLPFKALTAGPVCSQCLASQPGLVGKIPGGHLLRSEPCRAALAKGLLHSFRPAAAVRCSDDGVPRRR